MNRLIVLSNVLNIPLELSKLILKYDFFLKGAVDRTIKLPGNDTDMYIINESKMVLSDRYARSITIVNLETKKVEHRFYEENDIVKLFIFHNRIVTLLDNGKVNIWNPVTKKLQYTYDFNIEWIEIYDKDYFLSQEENTLTLWDPKTGETFYEYQTNDRFIAILSNNLILLQRKRSIEDTIKHYLVLLDITTGESFTIKTDDYFFKSNVYFTIYTSLGNGKFVISTIDNIIIVCDSITRRTIFTTILPNNRKLQSIEQIVKFTDQKILIVLKRGIIYTLNLNSQHVISSFPLNKIGKVLVLADQIIIHSENLIKIWFAEDFFNTIDINPVFSEKLIYQLLILPTGKLACLNAEYNYSDDEEYERESYSVLTILE